MVRMTTFESVELIHLTGITCMCEVGLSNWFASQSVCLPVQCNFFFLADTEKLYTEVTQSIVDRYGKTYDWSIKTQVMGRPPLDAAKVAVELLELPLTPMEFHTELYSKLNSKFPDANMMPGVDVCVITCLLCYLTNISSFIPRPPPFFVLRFAFSKIYGLWKSSKNLGSL